MHSLDSLKLSFFDLSLDLLCIAGTDGYLKKVNSRWTDLLGFSEDELCSQLMTHFIHPEDVEGTVNIRKLFAAGQGIIGYQNRYRCSDGTYKLLEWTARKEGDFVIGVARDITTRVQMERLAAIGELASQAGHAINNPLMIANFQVEQTFTRLKQTEQLDEKYAHYYQRYMSASERIARAVWDLKKLTPDESAADRLPEFAQRESIEIKMSHVLIVDDEVELAELLKEALETDVIKVHVAANGVEALAELKKTKFDIVVTDGSMPVMDGKTLIKNIRRENLLDKNGRIFIMTGAIHSVFTEEEAAMECFSNCCIIGKPISSRELKSKLKLG